MTPEARKSLAEQLNTNPLLPIILDEVEKTAIERCINAPATDHETRAAFAAEARGVRAFRRNLEASLRDTQPRKDAPA
jgi:hypothetical protein